MLNNIGLLARETRKNAPGARYRDLGIDDQFPKHHKMAIYGGTKYFDYEFRQPISANFTYLHV